MNTLVMEYQPKPLVIEPEVTMGGPNQTTISSVPATAAPFTPVHAAFAQTNMFDHNNMPIANGILHPRPSPSVSETQHKNNMNSKPDANRSYMGNPSAMDSYKISSANVAPLTPNHSLNSIVPPLPISLHKNVTSTFQNEFNKVACDNSLQNNCNNNAWVKGKMRATKDKRPQKTTDNDSNSSKTSLPWDAKLREAAQITSKSSIQDSNNAKPEDSSKVTSKDSEGPCNEMIIDGKKIPFVKRDADKNVGSAKHCFLPVTVIEKELLSIFPREPPEAIKNRPPLEFSIASDEERKQLASKITIDGGECRLVEFNAFMQFFEILKKCVKLQKAREKLKPKPKPPQSDMPTTVPTTVPTSVRLTGWLQLDNSIVPFVRRPGKLHLPKCVVEYVCKDKLDRLPIGLPCSFDEAVALNKACRTAGISITFTSATVLVPLDTIESFGLYMSFLPDENPLRHAKFLNSDGVRKAATEASVDETHPNAESSRKRPSSASTISSSDDTSIAKKKSTPDLNHSKPTESGNSLPVIETNDFKGKSLACLKRGSNSYVLLEAIVRVFLPFQSIRHIRDLLVAKEGNQLDACTRQEEQAFIRFYQIPTDKLQNNALLDMDVLNKHFEYLTKTVSLAKSGKQQTNSVDKGTGKPPSEDEVIILD